MRQLEEKYVLTEEWASVRDGSAIRKCLECGTKLLCLGHTLIVLFEDGWRPDVENLSQDVEDAKHFLDFSPYSSPGKHYGIDPSEFEYCAPGVF